jgi:hypothetical protein
MLSKPVLDEAAWREEWLAKAWVIIQKQPLARREKRAILPALLFFDHGPN